MENLDKPISLTVSAFDANENFIFKFISKSGARIVKNRLVIRDNETNSEVYNQEIESYKFEHLLPKQSLKNGKVYNFYFITYDAKGNASPKSDSVMFYCFTSPILEITNIKSNMKIDNTYFNLEILYNQQEGELLDFIKVIITDEFGNELLKSKNLYNTQTPPLNFVYELKGLRNKFSYYIKIVGKTIHGTIIESQTYILNVESISPSFESLLELENKCNDGYVEIRNNFIIIENDSYPKDIQNNPKYFYDGKINLIEDGTFLKWLEGFNISKDFTAKIFLENPNLGKIITLGNGNNRIDINFEENRLYLSNEKKYQASLKCYDNFKIPYVIYSNFSNSKKNLMIWIRRKDNLFEIILEDLDKKTIYWNSNTGIYYDEITNIYWN